MCHHHISMCQHISKQGGVSSSLLSVFFISMCQLNVLSYLKLDVILVIFSLVLWCMQIIFPGLSHLRYVKNMYGIECRTTKIYKPLIYAPLVMNGINRQRQRNPHSIFMTPSDPDEIYKVLKVLKPKKSPGHDNLSTHFLKSID